MSRHRCDKFPCSTETCEHHRTPLEVKLTKEVRALLAERLPKGTRALMSESPFWEVRIRCGGAIPDMAYTCCLKPGHTGNCYCAYKSLNFIPVHC